MIPNADITIYNKYVVNRAEKWARFQIPRVVWQSTRGVNRTKPGVIASDTAFIMIPFARNAAYLAPLAWQALANKAGFWTLQEGDYIVRGLITTDPNTASLITTLKAANNEVVQIMSVDAMDEGSPNMQHFELSCK